MERQIVTIKLPVDLVEKIERAADKQNRSRSNYIETILKREVEKKK